jgi:pyruvate/2-oxoglutarate dehydrogenase complex dihydrolipoamide dehydrogenase (E3) component
MVKNFEVIIIGAGQAGGPLARKLAAQGVKTAIIERRFVGGTCINDGCTPTKSWVASADAAYAASRAANLGIDIPLFTVNMAKIKARKDEIVHSFREG